MHTTAFATEPIGRLYEVDALESALRDARRRTLALYAHLDLARIEVPCLPIVNLPRWELAHIAWFQEYWCCRQPALKGEVLLPSVLDSADSLFDSTHVPHASRWHLPYPRQAELFAYMDATLQSTLDALARTPGDERYFFELALSHEDMHGEALLMSLQTLGLPPPPGIGREPPPSHSAIARDIHFAGGEFALGAERGSSRFVFDNEKWAHPVFVRPFEMAERPVTAGEYSDYLRATDSQPPSHWKHEGGAWQARRFDSWLPLDMNAPVVHVSQHEALAYCEWVDRRLPTEAEWEFAATNGGCDPFPWGSEPAPAGGALDLAVLGPSLGIEEPYASRSGVKQLMGGVWEWTSSPFKPYPAFKADSYREYSEPWFDTHFVLRGGSFATRSRLVHGRLRNFYLPERTDAFTGFRTCAVGAT